MAAQRMEFHKAPFTVFRIHPESAPDQHRCGNDPETDADPLVDTCHVHDDEDYEQREQSSRKDEQVLALESLELRELDKLGRIAVSPDASNDLINVQPDFLVKYGIDKTAAPEEQSRQAQKAYKELDNRLVRVT